MPITTSTVILWVDAQRAALAQAVMQRMTDTAALRVIAVSGPRRSALADIAQRFAAPVEDDLRKLLLHHPAAFLLMATADGLTAADLAAFRRAGTAILAIEPPAALPDSPDQSLDDAPLIVAPSLTASPVWLSAAEPQEALGPIHSASLLTLAPPSAGSLAARLYLAMQALVQLIGVPQSIDAHLTGPLAQPPDDLRGLTGHLTANLRFPIGASAALHASDRSAQWLRRLQAHGQRGELILDDLSYQFFDTDSKPLDNVTLATAPPDPADLIAEQWRRAIDQPTPPPAPGSPSDPRTILACCQATLLSCRTAQLESPETFLRFTS